MAELPTTQDKYLEQTDYTETTNGYGINYVSNNKVASQTNWNDISNVLSPFVR